MRIRVKVVPRAKRTQFAGRLGEEWKLQIAAPPVDGKANAAVIEFLSKELGVSRPSVRIIAGEHSQHKTIEIDGVTEAQFANVTSADHR